LTDNDNRCLYKNKADTPFYECYYDKAGSIKYFIKLLGGINKKIRDALTDSGSNGIYNIYQREFLWR